MTVYDIIVVSSHLTSHCIFTVTVFIKAVEKMFPSLPHEGVILGLRGYHFVVTYIFSMGHLMSDDGSELSGIFDYMPRVLAGSWDSLVHYCIATV